MKKPANTTAGRDKALDALLDLLATRAFNAISLTDIAERAELPLAELRQLFDSPLAMLSAVFRRTDQQTLAAIDPLMADEPARDRLFDLLMKRLDVLGPHKEALRSLRRSARRDPPLAMAMLRLAARSMQWMLAGARLDAAGPRAAIRAHGLALLYARVIDAFLDDDDPGLARTMAELDRRLADGSRLSRALDGAMNICSRIGNRRSRQRHADEEAAVT